MIERWIFEAGMAPAAADSHGPDPLKLSPEDRRRRRLARITLRDGQVGFRRKLMVACGGQCAFTGCAISEGLEAAHIRPYHGEDHHDVRNGLLLRRDLHALFDAELIGVFAEETIFVVDALRGDLEYASLHGRPMTIPKSRDRPDPKLLATHLAAVKARRPRAL